MHNIDSMFGMVERYVTNMKKMYIELEDLICYMDSFSLAFFDRNTYNLYFENELLKNSYRSRMLQLPKVDEKKIIGEFIKLNHMSRNKKSIDIEHVSISMFHREINNIGLYDEWIYFRSSFLSMVAKKWCIDNNINFI